MKCKAFAICYSGLVFAAAVYGQPEARVLAPRTSPPGEFVQNVPLRAMPPFVHWDLREFPNCQVPWVLGPSVSDIDGNGDPNQPADRAAANAALGGAFGAWRGAAAIIDFVQGAAAPPATTSGLALDGHNTLNFADAALDDDQVISLNQDDVQVIVPGALAGAGALVVGVGADGVRATGPRGDDVVGLDGNIYEPAVGGNGIADTVANRVRVAPAEIIVAPGPNGVLETQPQGDDVVIGVNIVDGGNTIAESAANNQEAVLDRVGLTGLFFNNQSGVIQEADIVFSPAIAWRNYAHGAVPAGGTLDLQMVATHEIGHFIGIAHPIDDDDDQKFGVGDQVQAGDVIVDAGPDGFLVTVPEGDDVVVGNTIQEPAAGNCIADTYANNNVPLANPAPNPIMNPEFGANLATNHMLGASDILCCNFLYTPDLGDAPDPPHPTLVHGAVATRTLNGIQLFAPKPGPEHLFGYPDSQLGSQFEWLGPSMDNSPLECEARVVDLDLLDDGVTFPNPLVLGAINRINVLISHTAQAGRYAANDPTQYLYYNGYFDFPNNGLDGSDLQIWWTGVPGATKAQSANCLPATFGANTIQLSFDLFVPAGAAHVFWSRHRLDYGEDDGLLQNISGDLIFVKGAAQFGEVEDYRHPTVERDHFAESEADVEINGVPVTLTGPATVDVFLGSIADTDGDGSEEVPTEMIEMELTGTFQNEPVIVRLRPETSAPFKRSLGQIKENENIHWGVLDLPPFTVDPNDLSASSVFDMYFEIELQVAGQTVLLHNGDEKHMECTIHEKPPGEGETYEYPYTIQLLDEDGTYANLDITAARHIPRPRKRACCHSDGTCTMTLPPGCNGILGAPYTVCSLTDCNGNGADDFCDVPPICQGPNCSQDCNGNLIPDECEVAVLDCNGNGRPDDCDIASGTSQDCNGNGIPDECDLANCQGQPWCMDCNGNGVPDGCDIANGTSQDCNNNGIPDECDIANGTSCNCNDNGIPDECDIANGTSQDCNGNGIPNECEIGSQWGGYCATPGVPCFPPECVSDWNHNGVPDSCEICGDLDIDGNVDMDDYWMFLDAFGTCIGNPHYRPDADLDGDGCVTLLDYQAWRMCYKMANGKDFVAPKPKPSPAPAPKPRRVVQ